MRGIGLLLPAVALALACTGEHAPGVVAVESEDCLLCHESEYQAAIAPPHVGVFPPECALCHNNTSWTPAAFEHSSVANRECVLCHQVDYDNTTDPVHPGSYPTTCQDCHTTNAWRPAIDGEHPEAAFAVQSGPHEGYGCIDCHDPGRGSSVAGANTDCIGCHTGEHSMSRVNDQHLEVSGYDFNPAMPNFCLVCHPNGRQ